MAQNVTVAGASYSDVPSVELPKTGGGTASFTDVTDTTAAAADVAQGKYFYNALGAYTAGTASGGGGGESWSWMGKNPTLVHTFTSEHVLFKNSPLATWTYGTSANTIRAEDNLTQVTVDDTHDYIFLVKFYEHYDYGNWTPVAAVSDFAAVSFSYAYRYSTETPNVKAGIKNTIASGNMTNQVGMYYYNSSGSNVYYRASYGMYLSSASNMTITNPTSATPILTCKRPALMARGSTTYFSRNAFNNLDMDASYYDATYELWSVDAGTYETGWQGEQRTFILNNGI